MKTVCVTGHRPAKLPWGYKKEGPDYDEYIESLACTIADYLENGYDHFITGMALGVDMDFAETVIQFREHYDLDVKLECAIPCPNQTLKWSPTETARYKEILEKADKVTMRDFTVYPAINAAIPLTRYGQATRIAKMTTSPMT